MAELQTSKVETNLQIIKLKEMFKAFASRQKVELVESEVSKNKNLLTNVTEKIEFL